MAEQELLRVKLVPLKSTWTCPSCNHQNVYTEGIVSSPQNTCLNCGTKVEIGAARSTTSDYRRGVEDAATVVENKGVEYEKLGDYGINQGFVQRVIASNKIAEAIRALLTAEQGADGWTQDVPTEQGWYWHCHDEKSVPFPLSILRDGAGKQKCFVAHDQAGLLRAIDCDEYGGWWKRILLPAPPDAVVDEEESK